MLRKVVLNILRTVLGMIPYRFQQVQTLGAGDEQQRFDFANEFLIRYESNQSWLEHILWTDGAHFTLTGYVNSKNTGREKIPTICSLGHYRRPK